MLCTNISKFTSIHVSKSKTHSSMFMFTICYWVFPLLQHLLTLSCNTDQWINHAVKSLILTQSFIKIKQYHLSTVAKGNL